MNALVLSLSSYSRLRLMAMPLLLMLAAAGCAKSTHITTSAAGHQIYVEIEGDHALESHQDQAVISSQFGKITIEKSRVQMDGLQWTPIPEGVPVSARISKGKQWVKAGSVTIARTVR